MTNLIQVVRQANVNVVELKKDWKNDIDLKNHYMPFYEQVKGQCDFDMFLTICIQDIKHTFIVGGAEKMSKKENILNEYVYINDRPIGDGLITESLRVVEYDDALIAMQEYAAFKVNEALIICKAMTEHLDQEERNEYFDSKIKT